MKFTEGITPTYSSDLYYDLFDGGYIKPERLLHAKEDVKRVYDAINLVQSFLDEAQEAEVLVVT